MIVSMPINVATLLRDEKLVATGNGLNEETIDKFVRTENSVLIFSKILSGDLCRCPFSILKPNGSCEWSTP